MGSGRCNPLTHSSLGYTPDHIAVDGDRLTLAGIDSRNDGYIAVYNAYTGELVWLITNELAASTAVDFNGRSVIVG
jgi:hypothetical protein